MARLIRIVSILALVASVPLLSVANVINVPAELSTIQAGIDSAETGDTVLVAQGTYYENINFKGKSIVVTSHYYLTADTSDILSTIIDGSQPVHPDSGSTVYFVNGEDSSSVLFGLTLLGGPGTRDTALGEYHGDAINILSSFPRFGHCRILGNDTQSTSAIELEKPNHHRDRGAVFDECEISASSGKVLTTPNWYDGTYGAIYLRIYDSQISGLIDIARGVAEKPRTAKISVSAMTNVLIERSYIEQFAVGLSNEGYSVKALGSNFKIFSPPYDGTVELQDDTIQYYSGRSQLTNLYDCVVDSIRTEGVCQVSAYRTRIERLWIGVDGAASLYNCTLLGSVEQSGPTLGMYHCLVAPDGDTAIYMKSGAAILSCCNIWDTSGGDWYFGPEGYPPDSSNISFYDPLFCDPGNGDYRLDRHSPCLPEHPLNLCDSLIGAYGEGCVVDDVVPPDSISDLR